MPTDITYQTPQEIRARFLRDLELGLIDAGIEDRPATDEGSEYYILGTALANMGAVIYAQLRNVEANTSELTATGEALDRIRVAIGLPEIVPSAASGRVVPSITASSVPFPDGLEFTLDRNGLRGAVLGFQVVVPGGSVLVRMLDTGVDSNAEAEENITWASPPNNTATKAYVDSDGLTGGADAETDERKRARILNRRRYQSAGSWGHTVQLAESATASVQKAFCFPALLGPSSAKVVVQKSMQLDRKKALDFSRELGEGSLQYVRNEILQQYPIGIEIAVQSAQDELFSTSLHLTLADPQKGGFVNSDPWPVLDPADDGYVYVVSASAPNAIVVSAETSTSPVVGQSIAWWSPSTREFVWAVIASKSGSAGAWSLVLDRPLVSKDSSVGAGDFISPRAHNMQTYGQRFLERCNALGPGENTESEFRLPRAYRRPFKGDAWDSQLSASFLKDVTQYPEILDYAWGYRSQLGPTVPATEAEAPNVLVPLNFGIYEL